MAVTYDSEANAHYYYQIKAGTVARTAQRTVAVLADYNEDGDLLGVEIIGDLQQELLTLITR